MCVALRVCASHGRHLTWILVPSGVLFFSGSFAQRIVAVLHAEGVSLDTHPDHVLSDTATHRDVNCPSERGKHE